LVAHFLEVLLLVRIRFLIEICEVCFFLLGHECLAFFNFVAHERLTFLSFLSWYLVNFSLNETLSLLTDVPLFVIRSTAPSPRANIRLSPSVFFRTNRPYFLICRVPLFRPGEFLQNVRSWILPGVSPSVVYFELHRSYPIFYGFFPVSSASWYSC